MIVYLFISRERMLIMNTTKGIEKNRPSSRNRLPWLAAPTASMLSMPMLMSATMIIQTACQHEVNQNDAQHGDPKLPSERNMTKPTKIAHFSPLLIG